MPSPHPALPLTLLALALALALAPQPAPASPASELDHPRVWTSASGTRIKALFSALENDTVLLTDRQGRPLRIPLSRLSPPDQDLIRRALLQNELPPDVLDSLSLSDLPPTTHDPPPPPASPENFPQENIPPAPYDPTAAAERAAARTLPFAGTNHLRTGTKNIFLLPITPNDQSLLKKAGNPNLQFARAAIWLPIGFDPARPWHVFLISQTDLSSSVDHLDCYIAALRDSTDWIGIAADSATMPPAREGLPLRWITAHTLLRAMAAQWPGAETWPIAVGGFSGAAQHSAYIAAKLLLHDYTPIGMYMGGCSENCATDALSTLRPDRSRYRQIPICLANGASDPYAPIEKGEAVLREMKGNGFRRLRLLTYNGTHIPDTTTIIEALRWFADSYADSPKNTPASPASPTSRTPTARPQRPPYARPTYLPPPRPH